MSGWFEYPCCATCRHFLARPAHSPEGQCRWLDAHPEMLKALPIGLVRFRYSTEAVTYPRQHMTDGGDCAQWQEKGTQS